MNHLAKVNFKARHLILDYALGAAIVALLPIPNMGIWQAIALPPYLPISPIPSSTHETPTPHPPPPRPDR